MWPCALHSSSGPNTPNRTSANDTPRAVRAACDHDATDASMIVRMDITDRAAVDGFGDRLVAMLNESALALMFSIGHRTGLFDVLADLPPLTSTAIAERAGLQERYVREWLNALTVGKVVVHDVDAGT